MQGATNASGYNECGCATNAEWGCNECEIGCNGCGLSVQRMRQLRGATNANNGVQQMREWGAMDARAGAQQMQQQMRQRVQQMRERGATNADSNGCFTRCNKCKCVMNVTMGATDAQLGVRELCLGARRASDSNTKWWRQGSLPGAHNLLGNGVEQRETSQTSVLRE
jgi:hypothetical protein